MYDRNQIFSDEIKNKYPYLYETHLHTNQVSACGHNTPEEMVRACKEYGYTGIIVTEHNWGGNTCVDRSLPWGDFVEEFCKSYEAAKKEGEKIGLQVFFGWEAGYEGTEFLIYGLDKAWLLANPEIKDASIEEQFRLVHAGGGIVVHAHPFREEDYIPEIRLFPEYVDGVEGVNAMHSNSRSMAHNDPEFDTLARNYAKEQSFPMTAGSDIHTTRILGGGVLFEKPLKDIHDFTERILSKEGYLLTNGERYYKSKSE